MKRRNTFQKTKILEWLKGTKSHPTAEVVYEGVRKEIPTISLGTVYRNLNVMAEDGEILKLEVGGEYRFDSDMCFHQHGVCTGCGKIFDLFSEEVSKCAMNKVKSEEFEPTCVQIIYHGKCKRCKK